MLITISCAPIGHIRNNVGDLIGAKNTMGKECCSNVSSRLWGGALRDDTKNGCEGDYIIGRSSFLTCGYAKRRNKLLRGLRYANLSLTKVLMFP